MVRILGLDPGSRITGYGVVDAGQSGVRYVASGCIRVGNSAMAGRLLEIHRHVVELVDVYTPGEIAIERVFMHRNADSALKLGQARGAALCGACHAGAPVFEYAPRAVKQTVTGTGAADKAQVLHMIKALLALQGRLSADAADALAIALCHAQHRGNGR
ncbi:MAG: crossover junction endodeoxyribonuclease RuvC, partial [Steroidobacteraceae bacterium]